MEIRNCQSGDVELLAGLIRSSFADVAARYDLTPENAPTHPSNCTPEWIETAMGKGVAFFLLESPEVAAGCVALERADSEVCYLERLAVLPEYRRRGYGRQLVGHALDRAKSLGALRVEIALIAAQEELMAFYRDLGFIFKEIKEFPHLPFKVAFMFRKV